MNKTYTFLAVLFFSTLLQAQVEPMDTDTDGFRNVTSLEHLKWITENSSCWGDKFKMDNDIDASTTSTWSDYSDITGFKPIASGYMDKFTGTFDGNGFKISGLHINSDVTGTMPALFCKTEGATITNLNLENCNIFSSKVGAAALIATCKSTSVTNCKSSGTVNGDEYIGGLIAKADESTISTCTSSVNLPGTQNYAGGLIAYANSNTSISDSYATGAVSGNNNVGGLIGSCSSSTTTNSYSTGAVSGDSKGTGGFVGYNYQSTVSNCYTKSSVTLTGNSAENTGGFVGENSSGTITLCYATGAVTSEDSEVGGFVGNNGGSIEKCYATGAVTGYKTSGGFVGLNEQSSAIIKNCYSRGDVHATVDGHPYVGGFAGKNDFKAQLENCYSTGKVTAVKTTSSEIGGFVGDNNSSAPAAYQGIITNSYWDVNTSDLSTSNGGEGKSTSEMKQSSAFNTWNFSSLWSIDANKNAGYPHLSNYVTGIRKVTSKVQFSVYPNPSSDYINIEGDLSISDIKVYSVEGKRVKQLSNINNGCIDVSNLNTGTYILIVESDKGQGITRFIKQ